MEREFGRLLNDAKAGELILVEESDRIGRQNPFVLGKLLYDAVQRGIEIHVFNEGKIINSETIEELETQFSVFTGSAIGFGENRKKIKRLISTTNNAFLDGEKGIQSGTLRKYLPECYRWNPITEKIEIDEDKAAVIKRIFSEYCEGIGTTTICKRLNADKIPTIYKRTLNKGWTEISIKRILNCQSYSGVLNLKNNKHKITCIPKVISTEAGTKPKCYYRGTK